VLQSDQQSRHVGIQLDISTVRTSRYSNVCGAEGRPIIRTLTAPGRALRAGHKISTTERRRGDMDDRQGRRILAV
jgi:hypothetical protein